MIIALLVFYPCDAMLARYLLSSCVWLSICLSICLSQVCVLLRPLNLGSRKQCHTTAQGL